MKQLSDNHCGVFIQFYSNHSFNYLEEKMSEDLIIKHCSPTLAGIKTANLFNCPYSSRLECECDVRKLNKMFCKKGIKVLPLKFSNGKALIYIFRPSKLAVDLSDEYACKLLESQGYHSHDATRCIRELRHRLKDSTEFPHEIGLFLGYPPEDVRGFILHKGNCCKYSGCWKVYGNEEKAVKEFANSKNVLTSITLSGYRAHLFKN